MSTLPLDVARRLRWRAVTVIFVMMMMFGVTSAVAEAKMPPFEIDIAVEGTTATITVAIDGQYKFDAADLDGLLGVFPEAGLDDRFRPASQSDAIEVDLDRVGPGIFRGTVDLERAGRWAVVPFPSTPEYEPSSLLYPDTTLFRTNASAGTLWKAAAFGVVALLVFGCRMLVRTT